jgi:hypothetical protein
MERIEDMRVFASKRRKQRSWDRINEAIEQGDEVMSEKLANLSETSES